MHGAITSRLSSSSLGYCRVRCGGNSSRAAEFGGYVTIRQLCMQSAVDPAEIRR